MRKRITAAACAAMLGVGFGPASADAIAASKSTPTPPATTAKSSADDASSFIHCDGAIAHRSAGEIAGRLLLIMATSGIAGAGEKSDINKRLSGADGVAACNDAISRETYPLRLVQLTLARAVHHIEAKDYAAALTDAKQAPTLAPDKASDLGFQHSLLVSSLEIQAAALVRLNRPAEAEATAMQMAAAAPYDVIALQHAAFYAALTPTIDPAKKTFLDRLAKLSATGLVLRASAYEWAGDFADAASDSEAFSSIGPAFAVPDHPIPPLVATAARRAVDLALANDQKESDDIAAATRKTIDGLIQSGSSLNIQTSINEAEEMLDLQSIIAMLAEGKAHQARMMFTARSRWLAASPGVIAEVTARLRKGASPAELVGPLSHDPKSIIEDGLVARAGALISANDADKNLFLAIRPSVSADDYSTWARAVWDTDPTEHILKKTGKEEYDADVVAMSPANGIPTGDAVLMRCAVIAQEKGKAGFVFYPSRPRLDWVIVHFVNVGDAGAPPQAFFNANTVIADLSAEFPQPRR